MIAECERCNRVDRIYNPRQKVRMCNSCYNYSKRNKERVRLYQRTVREKNREKYNKYMLEYYHKNKERIKEQRKKNKEMTHQIPIVDKKEIASDVVE